MIHFKKGEAALGGTGRKWPSQCCLPFWKAVWHFPRKLNMLTPYAISKSVLKYVPKQDKSAPLQKHVWTLMEALVRIVRKKKWSNVYQLMVSKCHISIPWNPCGLKRQGSADWCMPALHGLTLEAVLMNTDECLHLYECPPQRQKSELCHQGTEMVEQGLGDKQQTWSRPTQM